VGRRRPKGYGARHAPPTQLQREEIASIAQRLKIDVPEPRTQTEARFVLEDLRHREGR
jgi:hypothetical protein